MFVIAITKPFRDTRVVRLGSLESCDEPGGSLFKTLLATYRIHVSTQNVESLFAFEAVVATNQTPRLRNC
jgi:hypothetical protein